MRKKGLIRKIRLISKFITSQLGKETVALDISLNILRISKGIWTVKFGQLIEYDLHIS